MGVWIIPKVYSSQTTLTLNIRAAVSETHCRLPLGTEVPGLGYLPFKLSGFF